MKNNIKKNIWSLFIFLILGVSAQGQIWIEDFDGSNSSSFLNTSTQCGGDPFLHYFGVVCLSGGGCPIPLSPAWTNSYNNVMGNFLGAYDTDNANGCGGVGSDDEFAEWMGIDISSCSEPSILYLCFDVAHFGNGQAAGAGWDPPSNTSFVVTIDGGSPITLSSIEDQGQNTSPAFDLDCDFSGDASHVIDNTFTSYCFQIPGYGSSVDVRININGLNESFEDIGIDNVGVYCEADPGSLPGTLLQGCGICSIDNDCDGVIVSEDCDDNDASVTMFTDATFNSIPNQCAGEGDPLPAVSIEGFTGSWLPVFDPNTTMTYTFTPDADQCANEGMATVMIDAQTATTFNSIPSQCAGEGDPLPATSNEGVTGDWSPVFDPNNTTIYTFTPSADQCALEGMTTVTIDAQITATFNSIPNQCAGEADPLPATSNEGVTGDWSPAFDANTTTTYTFTPDAGQCANEEMVTVTIDAQTATTFNSIPNQCTGGIDPLPAISNEGITGSWAPVFDPNTTTTYTFTPDANQCASEGMSTVTIDIESVSTFNTIPNQCAGEGDPLPIISIEGFTGSWSPVFDPSTTATYTFTPDANQCASEGMSTVTIDIESVSTFNTIPNQCAGEGDPLPTTSIEGFTGSWSPIFDPNTTTTYTFTPDANQCASDGMATVTIDIESVSTFNAIPSQCSGEGDPLPTVSNEGFAGDWSPTFDPNITMTYTFTPDPGQCAGNAQLTVVIEPSIMPDFTDPSDHCELDDQVYVLETTSGNGVTGTWSPSSSYVPSVLPSGVTVFTFIPNASFCADEVSINVTVVASALPSFTNLGPYCVDDTPDVLPSVSLNGISGNWSGSISTSTPGAITYIFTPEVGLCASETTMTIVVEDCGCTDPATININPIDPICENELLPLTAVIGGSSSSILWSSSGDGFFDNINSLTPNYTPGTTDVTNGTVTLSAITDDPDGTGPCSASSDQVILTINSLITPLITQLGPYCEDDTPDVLPVTSLNGIDGTWDGPISTIITGTSIYTFTPVANQCANVETMNVVVDISQIVSFDVIPNQCAGGLNPLPNMSLEGVSGTWMPVFDPNTSMVYTFTADDNQCASDGTITVNIDEQVLPDFNQLGTFCVNDTPDELPLTSLNGINGTWDGPIVTSGPSSNTYTFTPDNGECAISTTMQIVVNDCGCADPAQITIDPISPICENETIALAANLAGSASMLTWDSNGDGNFDDNTSSTATYTPGANDITNGLITLTATTDDPDGIGPCSEASANIVLTVNAQELPEFTQLGPYCIDDTPDALPLVSMNGISGTWNGPIVTSSPGSITYTFTPGNGECAISTTMEIVVNDCGCADPAEVTINPITPICENETITLTANLAGSASMVTWISNGDGAFDDNISSVATYSPGGTDIANGTVTLTATTDDPDGVGPCVEVSANVVLMINAVALPQFVQLGPYCIDDTPDALPLVSMNGFNGTWDGPIVTSVPGSSSYTFTPDNGVCATSTTMEIQVNDCGGCADPAQVTIDPILPICENETITLTANLAGSASMVTWSSNGGGVFDDNTSSTATYTPSASGTVTLTATTDDPDGVGPCSEAISNVILTINAQELPQFTQLGPYCIDDTPDDLPPVSVNGINGTWDGPIITSIAGSSTYTFTPDNGQCAINTTMEIEVNDCGCADPAQINIDPIQPICENETVVLMSNLAGSASMVTWSSNGDGVFDDDTSIATIYTPGVNDIANGTATLTATTDDPDEAGPCSEASDNIVLNINTAALPQFAQFGPYCIDDTSDVLPLTSMNGISGTWDGSIATSIVGSSVFTFTPDIGECSDIIMITVEVENCDCDGPTTVQACDDDNPCTDNDEETILDSDGSICIPCAGIILDCSNGPVTVMPCDDGDDSTTNDEETILDCDGSVCIPCAGTTESVDLVTIITPNGDGDNEALIFRGLENYPGNTLKIFNRWGYPVYEKRGYQSDDELWIGEKGGEELPSDTYYYILTYNNEVYRKSITILR